MLVKVVLDFSECDIDVVVCVLGELQVDGVIVINIIIDYSKVVGDLLVNEVGGLFGVLVLEQFMLVLCCLCVCLFELVLLVGVGGILFGVDVVVKMVVGVVLVQCYSGLIFCGLVLVFECVEVICCCCEVLSRGVVVLL